MNYLIVDKLIKNALMEDINYGDITTDTLFSGNEISKGRLIAKESGVIAGINVAKSVFETLDKSIEFKVLINDGLNIQKGNIIAELEGPSKSILKAERVALNILQRMSGIATKTSKIVNLVKDYDIKIVDTRKTLPGFRMLDKYSVTVGGGYNHRLNLSDFVMIKDNHIQAVGSITEAVKRINDKVSFTTKVEVEVENLDQLREAMKTKVDVIMLDNMDIETMKEAVKLAHGKFILEASGNITEENIRNIAATGVDIISLGALTHSVNALDISLKF
ncbi:carboxylating nicotinate-nucleotide diphosphorylase [Clostridium fermenticellae]|uniref:Probable nicotinate-nucleotide pyrophosphorylase [carboxylating] n=1 Tax=Clostridium fermenticellae TaxID=2068654 RepID=A0A386H4W4_9CLOT|nr:carboxylating nicotinate-nucleotide diphosphorylase [Clostridium fermenticellae]AYD40759.1 carboxylating nicotinate-nucleotide diphosphorylase [Clostridium fermenticellae]